MDQPDVNELQERYAAMTSAQFAALKREELTEPAQQAYDRERARRDRDEFRAKEARRDVEFAKYVEPGSKERGLARLIIGTIFLWMALVGIAVNPRGEAIFWADLGASLICWGAWRRQGWKTPLGTTWIVCGVSLVVAFPGLRRAAAQSGRVFEGSSALLAGGGIMAIVGVLLIAGARRGSGTS